MLATSAAAAPLSETRRRCQDGGRYDRRCDGKCFALHSQVLCPCIHQGPCQARPSILLRKPQVSGLCSRPSC